MTDFPYDVFLSHNSKDKPSVEWLAAKLVDNAGLNVFLDKWNLVPGEPWQEDLETALNDSQTVAVFLGPSGISGWHNEELRNALTTRVKDLKRRIIPVLLPGTTMPEDDEIPPFLTRLTWVDFRTGLDNEEAFHRLVSGIKGDRPGRFGTPSKDTLAEIASKPEKKKKQTKRGSTIRPSSNAVNVGGDVNTGGGDFIGRDKNVKVTEGGIYIGGNVTGSTVVTGNNNNIGSTVTLQDQYLQMIYSEIDKDLHLSSLDKADLRSEVKALQKEDKKGKDVDEVNINRHLRHIKRIAPDLLEVVLATIMNPVAGFSAVARKVADRMKLEAE